MSATPLRLFAEPGDLASQGPPRDWSRPTVAQVIDWFEANDPDPSESIQAQVERTRNRAFFRERFGACLVGECRPHQLLAFINERKSLKSNHTRKRWSASIQRPFNEAAKLGLIDRNPFKGVRIPKGKDGRDWTDAEYQTCLRIAPPALRRLLVFMRYSGCRPGELRTTTQSNLVVGADAIILNKHKTSKKTGKPRRIPLNRTLAKLLAWQLRHNPPGAEFVFLNSFGRSWSCRALCKRLLWLREKAKLSKEVKLHGLRHTFATHAIMNGVDVAILAQLLGHSNLATTQRYLHLAGKVDYLNRAMEQAVGGKGGSAAAKKPAF